MKFKSTKLKSSYILVLLLINICLTLQTYAQPNSKNENSKNYINSYFGLGIGLDYGGIGIQAEFLPSKYVGLFAGAGYALIDPAFNAGISVKLSPGKKFCPTLVAMYGYNAVLIRKDLYGGMMANSDIYNGPTVGAGAELKIGKRKQNKFNFGIRLPIRNAQFQNDYEEMKDDGYDFNPDILPVTFSIGFHFGIGQKKKN